MTKNQIEYAKLLEARRSNQAQELLIGERDRETGRHNVVMESIGTKQLDEQHRANLALEKYRSQDIALRGEAQAETRRHNTQSEVLQLNTLNETVRHNLAGESEVHRANLASESLRSRQLSEVERANKAQERLTSDSIAQRREQAQMQHSAQLISIQETKRHNIESEAELVRSNSAREAETRRSALAHEAETSRHNQELELNAQLRLGEEIRHNKETESETKRHGITQDVISGYRAVTDASDKSQKNALNAAKIILPLIGGK